MWTIPRISGAALVVVLLLSGCVPTPAPTSQTPRPTATPVFASEAEALAAATKAYAEYVRVSDEILADGGKNPERIEAVASGDAQEDALSGYGEFRAKELRAVGLSIVNNVSIQQFSNSPARGIDLVSIYACLDVSNVDVLDKNGVSVVSPQRPSRQPFQVSERWDKERAVLVVSSREPWADGGVCEKD
ncbi:hypothetical protein ACVXZ4_12795 [Lacisediminihabitans sp. FW035]